MRAREARSRVRGATLFKPEWHTGLATIAAMPESASHSAATDTSKSGGRLVGPIALVIAIVGAVLAGFALYRSGGEAQPAPAAGSAPVEEPEATAQDRDDAKAQLCDAFGTVRRAVSLQTHADLGADPVALQAVAANARLAMIGGADYLRGKIDAAAPADLVGEVQSFSDGLQAIGINALAGITNEAPDQGARLQEAQTVSDRIVELCK